MANSDLGHKLTDKELANLERRIATLYREAGKELQATIDAYFEQFKKRDEEMKSLIGTVQNGKEWTEADYKQWRLNQIGRGERYQAMRDKVAHRVTDANAVAVSYTNDATPGIYSLNRNYSAYTIEQVTGNVGFDLWDEQTVKRLAVEQPDLMPYYPPKRALKRGIDLAYGKKQITASVTSSILQGKSIKHMADDLQKRITTMSRDSAIRTARTAVTGAQNAGRMDSYAAAEKMGIKLKKRWLATLDGRTRHAHAMLDGQTVDIDKPFKVDGNEIMFPGDTSAPGYLVYNCRCTVIADVGGVDTSTAHRRARNASTGETEVVSDMTYAEWAGWKEKTSNTSKTAAMIDKIKSAEEYAFLLGYYCHLITDAAFQAMIRDDDRVKATWMRIKADEELRVAAVGMDETWDSVKRLIPKKEHMREIYEMEAEYLSDHPNSGYLTEILPLKSFLDYIDYLPKGSIVRKIGVMGYLPELDKSINKFITMSRDEYANFVEDTIQLVIQQFVEKKLM